jgi:hypothetical protein
MWQLAVLGCYAVGAAADLHHLAGVQAGAAEVSMALAQHISVKKGALCSNCQ